MTVLKNELVRHYAWLRKYGYNDSHSGNASVRDGDRIWVTPTGACADTLQADDLVACSVDGSCGKDASFDAKLHIEVYKQNAKAHAVFHSHGPHTIALTMSGKDFIPDDFEGKLYFPTVPVHTIKFDDYSAESPRLVASTLSKYCITVVSGHGVYACAESINLAYKWTCSLEHSAKIAFLNQQLKT
ncbi:MAG: class II aldolase/adducin family protein [Gammaproteobacteria bacterium]|nr:MAG: class II aldolase/adducin family protein [Gammaproteobacteria bacterium]